MGVEILKCYSPYKPEVDKKVISCNFEIWNLKKNDWNLMLRSMDKWKLVNILELASGRVKFGTQE